MAAAGPPTAATAVAPATPAPSGTPASNTAFLQQWAADHGSGGVGPGHRGPTTEKEIEDQRLGKTPPKGHKNPLDAPEQPEGAPEVTPTNVPTTEAVGRIPVWFGGLPTPGSLIFPTMVLLVFLLLIMKTNGKSRWEWLWEVMTGNATVQTSAAVSAAQSKPAGGVLATDTVPPELKAAFGQKPENVTELDASTIMPRTFQYTPSASISVTSDF